LLKFTKYLLLIVWLCLSFGLKPQSF